MKAPIPLCVRQSYSSSRPSSKLTTWTKTLNRCLPLRKLPRWYVSVNCLCLLSSVRAWFMRAFPCTGDLHSWSVSWSYPPQRGAIWGVAKGCWKGPRLCECKHSRLPHQTTRPLLFVRYAGGTRRREAAAHGSSWRHGHRLSTPRTSPTPRSRPHPSFWSGQFGALSRCCSARG